MRYYILGILCWCIARLGFEEVELVCDKSGENIIGLNFKRKEECKECDRYFNEHHPDCPDPENHKDGPCVNTGTTFSI